jgi:integrase
MSQKLERIENEPHFYADSVTGIVYLVKSLGGKKFKISSGVKRDNLLTAKRKANQKLQERLRAGRVRITPLIKDEIPLWREVKVSEKLSPRTMVNIDQAIKRIEGFWGSMFPHEIDRANIAKWYTWLERNYPGQLKEKPIKYLRNFARFLAEKTHHGQPLLPAVPRIANPDYRETMAARKKKKGRTFTRAEFKAVYEAGSPNQKLVALFMYTMATRIEETLTLKFDEQIVDLWGDRPLYCWEIGQNKADLSGKHAIHSLTVERLRLRSRASQLVFPQLGNPDKPLRPQMIDWDGWRERANLGWHWTSHTFRHTCLTTLFSDEKNPQALICKLYRVSLAVALATYIHATDQGMEKMREAIEVKI